LPVGAWQSAIEVPASEAIVTATMNSLKRILSPVSWFLFME
jgi:hypothetical protein